MGALCFAPHASKVMRRGVGVQWAGEKAAPQVPDFGINNGNHWWGTGVFGNEQKVVGVRQDVIDMSFRTGDILDPNDDPRAGGIPGLDLTMLNSILYDASGHIMIGSGVGMEALHVEDIDGVNGIVGVIMKGGVVRGEGVRWEALKLEKAPIPSIRISFPHCGCEVDRVLRRN